MIWILAKSAFKEGLRGAQDNKKIKKQKRLFAGKLAHLEKIGNPTETYTNLDKFYRSAMGKIFNVFVAALRRKCF